MRGSITLFLFLFLFLFPVFVAAQEIPETLQESLNERNESETEDEDQLQAVLEAWRNPVNINTCRQEELLGIPSMTPSLAAAIIAHRERTGPYQSLYELQTLEGVDGELFRSLEGFFSISTGKTLEGLLTSANRPSKVKGVEYLVLITPLLQPRKGYEEGIYPGPPLRQWHRLQWRLTDQLRVGLNMENDAGEAFRWNSRQRGFDYYSGFLEYQGKDKRNRVIVGDYMTGSGQGLVHGRGRGFGSLAWVGRVYSVAQSRVYRSSEENLFYRGALFQNALGKGTHKMFVSIKRVDGGGGGLHRTETEYALKKEVRRREFGQALEYPVGAWRLGVQYLYTWEEGRKNFFGSLSHSWQKGNMLLFGEWATDGKSNISLLEALVWSLNKQMDLSLLFRHYPGEQTNPFASGFSSFSRPENETGLYLSTEWRPSKRNSWRFYMDKAYRSRPSYLVSTPYTATALFLEMEQKLPGAKLLLRFREDQGQRDRTEEEHAWKQTLGWKKRSLRLQLDWQQGEQLHHRSRLEFSRYRHGMENHHGYLFFQEMQWRPEKKKWYWILRYQYFFVPDYDARIYVYESDVLYAYSVPAYSGRGQRIYLLTRRHLFKGLDLWLKAGLTHYSDKTEIGSGNDRLLSDRVWDLKVELRWGL